MSLNYRVLALALLTLSLSCSPLWARSVIETWSHWLDQAERDLYARDWDSAYRKTENVSRGVMRHLRGGAGAEELLARIFVLQALAEAGRGNERLAHWNWDAALELYPPMEKLRLDAYGEAGQLLRQGAEYLSKEEQSQEEATGGSTQNSFGDITAPRRKFSPEPDFPRGRLDKQGVVIVQIVIDKEGQVWSPRILEDDDEPLMIYASLEAMRDWEFAPASLNGEPVDVYYNLTVGFNQ